MESFLKKLLNRLTEKHTKNFSDLCIVFPNKRAGLFFKKYLAEQNTGVIITPAIFSIQELVQKLSSFVIPERLTLVFELYRVYKKHEPGQTFDRFYMWGEMLLGDFDIIDKNLADAGVLFKNIRDIKQIENEFDFSLADIDSFRAFWEGFSTTPISEQRSKFLKVWEILNGVYSEFKTNLAEKGFAYEGMLYRALAEDKSLPEKFSQWNKVIFAGFNILSASERQIIGNLLKADKAEIYWDADKYYIDDKKQEAGHFLRRNFRNLKLQKPEWIENKVSTNSAAVNIFAVPLNIGQVMALTNELKKLASEPGFVPERTAIVLPDENMLIPLLYSLPENIENVNITMGFALRSTPFFSLIELLKELHKNSEARGSGEAVFYHKDVIQVLLHPYVKFLGKESIYETIRLLTHTGRLKLSPEMFLNEDVHSVIKNIFQKVSGSNEIFKYLNEVMSGIYAGLIDDEAVSRAFESEQFFHFYKTFNKLTDILNDFGEEVDINTSWGLIMGVLKHIKIPFTGEPLRGIQIMGVLETRLLDFDNVFILSMNEKIYPKSDTNNSFIPYNLRKAFGLPVYEDEDSGYAYNFYRLLHNVKNLYLFYNNEAGNFGSGEKSRFLSQVQFELARINKNISLKEHVVITDTGVEFPKDLSISKTPAVLDALENLKSLSPSALSAYIACPVKFYFRYVAGLKEVDVIEEVVDKARFGTIFHSAACNIYSSFCNKTVTAADIDKLLQNIDNCIIEVFRKELNEPEYIPSGKNMLLQRIIRRLLYKLLESDKKETPFKIIALEKSIYHKLSVRSGAKIINVNLGGKLDRIDEAAGISRIIDYKTGAEIKTRNTRLTEDEFYKCIMEDTNYSAILQAYIYTYIYLSKNKGQVRTGIYSLKKINDGIKFISESPMEKNDIEVFENYLKPLLEEIYNPSIPFLHTKEPKNCLYCEFKTICNRE